LPGRGLVSAAALITIALACLTDLHFGEWAVEAWPALSDAVLAELSR